MTEKLVEEWSKELVERTGGEDLAADPTGSTHNEFNATRNTWLVYGTWGRADFGTRSIRPRGKKLFIVAASSHATYKELPPGTPNNEENLIRLATNIDRLWMNPVILEEQPDGSMKQLELQTITTREFDVDIKNTMYTNLADISTGPTKMVTVARVHTYTSPAPPATARLIIAGQSHRGNAGGRREESYYNVQVDYTVE
jgi:hypothetical protein